MPAWAGLLPSWIPTFSSVKRIIIAASLDFVKTNKMMYAEYIQTLSYRGDLALVYVHRPREH